MALAAGVPPERMYLHGNAKTTAELIMALDAGVPPWWWTTSTTSTGWNSWPPARSGC